MRHPISSSCHHALFSSFSSLRFFYSELLARSDASRYSPCDALPRPEREKDFKNLVCMSVNDSSFVNLLNYISLKEYGSSNLIERFLKRSNLFAKLPKKTEGGFSIEKLVRLNPTQTLLERMLHISWNTKSEHFTFFISIV